MAVQQSVQAIRNLSSGKLFVLVEEAPDQKMTIINPEGKLITVPEGLFGDPEEVVKDSFLVTFTEAQVAGIAKHIKTGRRTRKKATT